MLRLRSFERRTDAEACCVRLLVVFPLSVSTEPLPRSRSFMRSLLSEEQSVGLLLFDEPSAALDPTAEHGADNERLLIVFILTCGCVRSFRATEKLERAEDHDFLLP